VWPERCASGCCQMKVGKAKELIYFSFGLALLKSVNGKWKLLHHSWIRSTARFTGKIMAVLPSINPWSFNCMNCAIYQCLSAVMRPHTYFPHFDWSCTEILTWWRKQRDTARQVCLVARRISLLIIIFHIIRGLLVFSLRYCIISTNNFNFLRFFFLNSYCR
jgi:hypothetical protein